MINLAIIGSGHYATGHTVLSGRNATDKDFGVLLPSALYLREKGLVDIIHLCGRDGSKLPAIVNQIKNWKFKLGLDVSIRCYPQPDTCDPLAYITALDDLPAPRAALIAVPDYLHAEVMDACIDRNIPFLIVKPAVTRLEDFYRIRSRLKEIDLLALVDFHKVFDEANLMLLNDIRNKNYGKIHHISTFMSQRRDMIEIYRRWLEKEYTPNVNHYLGSHYIHMVSFLTGARPLDVRAMEQHGYIKDKYGLDVADSIQTQIRWLAPDGYIFSSHHIAGWADPSETESMTFQKMHLVTENGHIFSDQRYRGTRKVLANTGLEVPNPYFFSLVEGLSGGWNLDTKYGFQSVRTFIELCQSGKGTGVKMHLPFFSESEYVTAVLEAADVSINADSSIVHLGHERDEIALS